MSDENGDDRIRLGRDPRPSVSTAVVRPRAAAADWATSAHLQAIVDATTAVIYVKDRAGRYLLINRQYERLFHVTRETFVGKTDGDVFPPETVVALRWNDAEVMRRCEPIEFEEQVPHDDGMHSYVSLKFPLVDADGTPEALCGISTDITHRRRDAERVRRLARRLVSIREEERQRLSFRIHDDICQELTGITFLVAAAARRLGPDAMEGVPELTRAAAQLGHVIDHLRSVAHGLHPMLLRDLGLVASLRVLAETVGTARTRVTVTLPETLPAVGDDVGLAIYRVTQEALLNAVRHGGARLVTVAVTLQTGTIAVAITDDGRGFDPGSAGGLGLLGMEERATAVGGTLRIASEPGRGTRVSLDCSLPPEA